MKAKEKRMILLIVLIGAVVIGGILLIKNSKERKNKESEDNKPKEEFVQVLEDGTKFNISNKLKEEKSFNGLKIGNIQLTEKEGQSVLLADVTNNTATKTGLISVYIVLYDKQGNEIAKVPGLVPPVEPGGTSQLNAGITEDYANAYDFRITER